MFQPDGHIPVSKVLCVFLLACSGRDGHIFYCDGHSVRKPRETKVETYKKRKITFSSLLTFVQPDLQFLAPKNINLGVSGTNQSLFKMMVTLGQTHLYKPTPLLGELIHPLCCVVVMLVNNVLLKFVHRLVGIPSFQYSYLSFLFQATRKCGFF